MDIIKCMCNGELYGYLPVSFISCEYRLPIGKLVEIENSHKGDVIHYLGDSFENIGDIDELLMENRSLKKRNRDLWKKFVKRGQMNSEISKQNAELLLEREALKADVERLKYNLSVLSSALYPILLFTEGLDVDDDGVITSAGTGEVLSE